MELVDGHMHLEYGPLSKEYVMEFVSAAVNKGLTKIQILDHSHRFKEFEDMYEPLKCIKEQKEWLQNKKMKFRDSLDDYIKLINEVKKMNLPLEVSFGLEVCYREDSEELIRQVLKDYSFDFIVGAVHSVGDILYDMPFTEKYLFENQSVDDIYRSYYRRLLNLVDSRLFDQLAHPDTIKMIGKTPGYSLKETYEKLADALIKKGMIAENNVGCTYRYHLSDLGCSDELLEIFIKKKVPIITASDAHYPKDVGTYISSASQRIEKIKEINY